MKQIIIKVPHNFKMMLSGWSNHKSYYIDHEGKIQLVIAEDGVEYVIVEDKDLTRQES